MSLSPNNMALKMIARLFQKCLLSPEDLNPSREDLEVIGVFNPGATIVKDEVVLMARVAERVKELRPGNVALPRWDPERGVVIDWIAEDELELLDPRVVQFKNSGLLRITFLSHLRVFRSRDGKSIDSVDDGRFMPQTSYEEFGVEDPRITRIDDDYYITYVAVSRHGAATALASTKDFQTFERHGVIFPPENKDVVLFPEKIDGEYLALHRPNPAHHFSPPEIWLARSRDLIRWGRHEVFQLAISDWCSGRVGAGAPPVRVPDGWLIIYHGNQRNTQDVGAYAAGALLLDGENPGEILRVGRMPILAPEADFERQGFVPNVVFPTGIVQKDDALLLYYGAADTNVGVVALSITDILEEL